MMPLIPLADVTVFGALGPEGEEFKNVRVTMIGNPTSAVFFIRLIGENRWNQVDRLTDAKYAENADDVDEFLGYTFEGDRPVGVAPEDAIVRWEVRPQECLNCN
jgi:hypothetical protein